MSRASTASRRRLNDGSTDLTGRSLLGSLSSTVPPDGSLVETIAVPAPHISCLALAGEDLRSLVVTMAPSDSLSPTWSNHVYLMRIGAPGAERPVGGIDDDTYTGLSAVVTDFDEAIFGDGGLRITRPVAERVAARQPNTIVGPDDDARIPRGSTKPDAWWSWAS